MENMLRLILFLAVVWTGILIYYNGAVPATILAIGLFTTGYVIGAMWLLKA